MDTLTGHAKLPKEQLPNTTEQPAAAQVAANEQRRTSRSGREIKAVEPVQATVNTSNRNLSTDPLQLRPGSGVQLGQIPVVEEQLKRRTGTDDSIRSLHRILYPTQAIKKQQVKANLRMWSGVSADASDLIVQQTRDRWTLKLSGWQVVGLKSLCEIFGIQKSGDKDAVIERIVVFLLKPVDSGIKTIAEKRTLKTKKRQSKVKSAQKKRRKSSKDSSDDEDVDSSSSDSGEVSDEDDYVKPHKSVAPKNVSVVKKKKLPSKSTDEITPESSSSESEQEEDDEDYADEDIQKFKKKRKALVKSSSSTTTVAKKQLSPQKKALSKDTVSDSDDSETETTAPMMNINSLTPPSQEELISAINNYLTAEDLSKVTKKTVMDHLHLKFDERVKSSSDAGDEEWWSEQQDSIEVMIDDAVNAL